MANETKKLSPNLDEEKRRRQLAILKASNEMLRQAKEQALERTSDPLKKAELEEQFDAAFTDNRLMARNYLNATQDEVDNATYREVDDYYVKKYNERLSKKGITDEELHQKQEATTVSGKKKKTEEKKRRPRKGAKVLDEDVVRIEGEEEIMKASMVKSDEDIQRQVQKNEKYYHDEWKSKVNPYAKLEETMKKTTEEKKIRIEENTERVVLEDNKADSKKGVLVREEENESATEVAEVKKTPRKKKDEGVIRYDFDFSTIPSFVQYDVIPLPSKGKCYPIDSPLRCGRIPVAYLTAADENIIASPNVYRDGKLFDILLERKVLDKRIKVQDLVVGDRDAIILWLRATAYTDDFPIVATNPNTGKRYNITVKLSEFDYKDFDLDSDDDGLFEYVTGNGDEIKFKIATQYDNDLLDKYITDTTTGFNKLQVIKVTNNLAEVLNDLYFEDEDLKHLQEDMNEIREIIGEVETDDERDYPGIITEQMIIRTVSVNGNTDKDYIRNYINNMRVSESLNYRKHINSSIPGVDFGLTVNIPESDGGGSFDTFLRFSDTLFLNF